MNQGRFNEIVTIRRYTTSRGEAGGFVKNWSNLIETPAEVIFRRSSEGSDKNQEIGVQIITVRMFKTDVTFKDELFYDDRNWDIIGIKPYGDKNSMYIEIEARHQNDFN